MTNVAERVRRKKSQRMSKNKMSALVDQVAFGTKLRLRYSVNRIKSLSNLLAMAKAHLIIDLKTQCRLIRFLREDEWMYHREVPRFMIFQVTVAKSFDREWFKDLIIPDLERLTVV